MEESWCHLCHWPMAPGVTCSGLFSVLSARQPRLGADTEKRTTEPTVLDFEGHKASTGWALGRQMASQWQEREEGGITGSQSMYTMRTSSVPSKGHLQDLTTSHWPHRESAPSIAILRSHTGDTSST